MRAGFPPLPRGTVNAPSLKVTRIAGLPGAGAIFIQHPAIQHTFSTTPSVTIGRSVKSAGFARTSESGTRFAVAGIGSPRVTKSARIVVDASKTTAQSSLLISISLLHAL